MADEKEKAVLEEEKDIVKSNKIVVIGLPGAVGGALFSNLFIKQTGKQKIQSISLAEAIAINNMGFVTIKEVGPPASEQFHNGYPRRDYKDFTKGNRNLKGRGRK